MNNNPDIIRELVQTLNYYRDQYYNHQNSEISDFEYDKLYDQLVALEKETGLILANSPTQTVGYEVKSKLVKVKHNHPMLSLDKTKNINDVIKFLAERDGVIMAKMDGLTCSVRYVDGKLVSAETRGNGEIGEDVLHCAKTIKNLPLEINCKDEVIIDGEVIITYDDFETINNKLSEDQKYKHPRNLASGSIRQLDSKVAAERNMKFVAWKLIKGCDDKSFFNRWLYMDTLGFDIVPLIYLPKTLITYKNIDNAITLIKVQAKEEKYPIDGCVFGYNDVEYGDSLGATSHHLKGQLAFKFYDELTETTLRTIEWTIGKTGTLTPTAVFDPIIIDNTEVQRASLHNVSIMRGLGLTKNCTVKVYKANEIIPQIDSADADGDDEFIIPSVCPVCCGDTAIKNDNGSEVLICTNPYCSGKKIAQLTHFVSRKAMNIDGLSEATLNVLIVNGFIKDYIDIYNLRFHIDELYTIPNFGEKSVHNLIESIEKSRRTTLDRFLTALSIPNIGSSAAKTIASYCNGSITNFLDLYGNSYDWSQLPDIGSVMASNLDTYITQNYSMITQLINELDFVVPEREVVQNDFINGKTFCVTGAFNTMKRAEIEKIITERGGKLSGSVSSKTHYLLTNETNSGTSKFKKAMELGIPIMTEEEFINKIK